MTVRLAAAFSVAAVITVIGGQAVADPTKAQCVAANGDAQSFRREGKLAEAREQLKMCMDPKCPNLVSTDCTKRLDELESAQPTVVFDVKDGAGHDVSTVKITMDGRPLAEGVDGTAISVNPGEHTFTFTIPGQAPLRRKLVLREGEKGRHEHIEPAPSPLAPSTSEGSAAPNASSSSTMAVSSGAGTQKVAGLTVAGLGAAGLVLGGVFGLMTSSAASRQKSDCASASSCNDYSKASNDHDDAVSKGRISTIASIGGGALLVGGMVLFFTAKASSGVPATTARIQLVPTAGPAGTGMLLHGAF